MTTKLVARILCLSLFLLGTTSMTGCGSEEEAQLVGGNDPKYQMPEDARANYEQSMQQAYGTETPGNETP